MEIGTDVMADFSTTGDFMSGKFALHDWNVTSTSLYTVFEDTAVGPVRGYVISKFDLDGH